jgi:hypothetical protein
VGVAAGLGARQMMLCSLAKRREAEYVAQHIEYIEPTNPLRERPIVLKCSLVRAKRTGGGAHE